MQVLSDGRVRRTEAEWRAIVSRYEASGLSVSAFCRRSKLARNTFVKWRGRLAAKPSGTREPAFVEWLAPVPSDEAAPAPRVGEFELELPGGVVLRWKA